MGKRKRKDDYHLKKKIRRLEDQLRRRRGHRYESSDSSEADYNIREYSITPPRRYYSRSPIERQTDSDGTVNYLEPSVSPDLPKDDGNVPIVLTDVPTENPVPCSEPGPSSSVDANATVSLPTEILEALGDPKGKDEVFGPKIPDELSQRWGRVLVDGLTKEQKQEVMEHTLVPDNFRLIKAPLLNPEIIPVLSETVKNRDKMLEKSQNHLGLGIAGLTNLTSAVIEKDLSKIEILKMVSEVSQIFLELHHENTITRKKLVITSLDKKFTDIIKDSKRDSFLFGAELGEKIKASKTAERSGYHIKRNDGFTPYRRLPNQGNWRGPPRTHGQRTYRQGGPKNYRHYGQLNRRAALPPPQSTTAPPPPPPFRPANKTRKF